jgi:predicted negative regulator of RcsB-dependent stress response
MAFDHQEQEQLDELKAWWNRYGNHVLLAVALIALVIAGYHGWRHYERGQALAAATLYDQLEQAGRAGDHKKVRDIAGQITAQYASTAFGTFAAFSAARAALDSGDLAGAKAQLAWAMKNAKEDEARDIARLRLAAVLLDEKNPAEALKQLEAKPADALAALYADLKGDILAAQGKPEEARAAYQLALDRSEAGSAYRGIVQLKMDALGEPKK